MLREVGTRVLVVDEVNSALVGGPRQQRGFLQLLRFLSNELGIAIVCAGVPEARFALRSDPQLRSRLTEVALDPWAPGPELQAFVTLLVQGLPLREPRRSRAAGSTGCWPSGRAASPWRSAGPSSGSRSPPCGAAGSASTSPASRMRRSGAASGRRAPTPCGCVPRPSRARLCGGALDRAPSPRPATGRERGALVLACEDCGALRRVPGGSRPCAGAGLERWYACGARARPPGGRRAGSRARRGRRPAGRYGRGAPARHPARQDGRGLAAAEGRVVPALRRGGHRQPRRGAGRREWILGFHLVCPRPRCLPASRCPRCSGNVVFRPVAGRQRLWCIGCAAAIDAHAVRSSVARWSSGPPPDDGCCAPVVLSPAAARPLLQLQRDLLRVLRGGRVRRAWTFLLGRTSPIPVLRRLLPHARPPLGGGASRGEGRVAWRSMPDDARGLVPPACPRRRSPAARCWPPCRSSPPRPGWRWRASRGTRTCSSLARAGRSAPTRCVGIFVRPTWRPCGSCPRIPRGACDRCWGGCSTPAHAGAARHASARAAAWRPAARGPACKRLRRHAGAGRRRRLPFRARA